MIHDNNVASNMIKRQLCLVKLFETIDSTYSANMHISLFAEGELQ